MEKIAYYFQFERIAKQLPELCKKYNIKECRIESAVFYQSNDFSKRESDICVKLGEINENEEYRFTFNALCDKLLKVEKSYWSEDGNYILWGEVEDE